MKTGVEPSTLTVPESNATNSNFIWTKTRQSLAASTLIRDVMQTMDFFIELYLVWDKVTFIVQKQ